jgi:hypothetical protein
LELAGAGVTWGHINDQAQTIVGLKTLEGGALIKGATSAAAAGYAGNISTAIKLTTDVVGPASAGAYVDITTTAVSIEPGTYLVMYYVTLLGKAATSDVVLTACVRDASNTIVTNSQTSGLVQNADSATLFCFVPLDVASTTSYKLSATANVAYGGANIWNASLTSTYTDENRARLSFIRL